MIRESENPCDDLISGEFRTKNYVVPYLSETMKNEIIKIISCGLGRVYYCKTRIIRPSTPQIT